MSSLQAPIPLHLSGVYRRHVGASMVRIWENVFDWEHLPWLHGSSFQSVDLEESGPWGWRIRLVNQPGDPAKPQILELRVDREAHRYTVTTLQGQGQGSEIRVQLSPRGAHDTDIEVSFFVPEARPERLAVIGARYIEVYTLLWDEDEAMMRERERALHASRTGSQQVRADPVRLGEEAAVRAALPVTVHYAGAPWRVVDLDGDLLAHATTCPHWLGPLDTAPARDGCITCPWHGYRFDVRTGASADGRALHLQKPPGVHVKNGAVWLGLPMDDAGTR